ncbi:MAG: PTS sugar transporter subunit IIB [Erysipelotrichaceae bacterium]|jgi:PTS system mannose-specific IIB component|nr:PTS sugar transporter subunit IIB [Erysipelotrichaceae bacterium]
MPIKWTRIDDRLIHGQVATSWLRYVNADQIIVANDKAAANPIQVRVLKMSVPDVPVHVFGVDQFIEIYKNNPIKKSTFLFLDSTLDVLKLVEGGIEEIKSVNYGGMRSREGRKEYRHDLCFSEAEEVALATLQEKGIEVNYQIAAFDEPVPVWKVLESVKK